MVISYNSKGNPTSMIRPNVATGAPNYLFRYDQQHRITDVIWAYENGYFEQWHHYVYGNKKGSNKHLPITDSIYTFGEIGTGPLPLPNYVSLRYVNFSYDSYGRIIKAVEVDVTPYPGTSTITYHYNAVGNLDEVTTKTGDDESTAQYTYDNKINVHRTNPIWQLIDRDFSVNNPYTAVSYNTKGLPTLIGAAGVYSYLLNFYSNGEMEIVYDCDQSTH